MYVRASLSLSPNFAVLTICGTSSGHSIIRVQRIFQNKQTLRVFVGGIRWVSLKDAHNIVRFFKASKYPTWFLAYHFRMSNNLHIVYLPVFIQTSDFSYAAAPFPLATMTYGTRSPSCGALPASRFFILAHTKTVN